MLEDEAQQKEKLEEEITILQSQLLQLSFEADEVCRIWVMSILAMVSNCIFDCCCATQVKLCHSLIYITGCFLAE